MPRSKRKQFLNSISKFALRFKSRKDGGNVISVRSRNLNRNKGAYSFLKNIKTAEFVDFSLVKNQVRIIQDDYGYCYICIPRVKVVNDNQVGNRSSVSNVISLDPGVRTFLTGFDPQRNNVVHIGLDPQKKILQILSLIDSLTSKKVKSKKRKKYKLKKVINRLRFKIKNMVNNLHYNTTSFLCKNYDVIILPIFCTKEMSEKKQRIIGKKTVRVLQSLSHFRFRQRLIDKAEEYGCKVLVVTEEYTSKTCTNCGILKRNLGGNKTFNCGSCKLKIDRDTNGARNILLKTHCNK